MPLALVAIQPPSVESSAESGSWPSVKPWRAELLLDLAARSRRPGSRPCGSPGRSRARGSCGAGRATRSCVARPRGSAARRSRWCRRRRGSGRRRARARARAPRAPRPRCSGHTTRSGTRAQQAVLDRPHVLLRVAVAVAQAHARIARDARAARGSPPSAASSARVRARARERRSDTARRCGRRGRASRPRMPSAQGSRLGIALPLIA